MDHSFKMIYIRHAILKYEMRISYSTQNHYRLSFLLDGGDITLIEYLLRQSGVRLIRYNERDF